MNQGRSTLDPHALVQQIHTVSEQHRDETDDDVEWDDLGEHIERKIKRKVREWLDED